VTDGRFPVDGTRRALVVLHEPAYGGATQAFLRAVPGLEERGWSFSYWVPPGDAFDRLTDRGEVVDGSPRYVHVAPGTILMPPGPAARLASFPPYFRRFVRYLRTVRPHVVHANTIITLPEALVARACGIPTLVHVHEMLPTRGLYGTPLKRLAWRTADELVAVSRACGARLALAGRLPRIVYESTPIPPERTPPRARELTVGTVGTVSPRKGTDLFVDAVAEVKRRTRAPVSFRIVGPVMDIDRAWAKPVLERAAELGIRHRVTRDIFEEIGGWDVFALPSREDPFPLAMLEAMAMGLPVVGTRVDGLAEQVTPEAGLLTAPEDPAALAEAMLELIEADPDRRAQLGRAGRERVATHFTPAHQSAGLAEAYDAVLERRPSPRLARR